MSISTGSNSSPINEQADAYKHPESALKVDMSTPDKAARSLQAINADPNLQGKKILFYKHGKNYYAVPNEDRPAFWHRQFFKCLYKDEQLEYANSDVGEKLGRYFGSSGGELKSKMKWGFWKQAVASEEFLSAAGEHLCDYATNLTTKLESAWKNELKARGHMPDAISNLTGTAYELAVIVDQYVPTPQVVQKAREGITRHQAEFWQEAAFRTNVSDKPFERDSSELIGLKDQLRDLGLSEASLKEIESSGLCSEQTVFTLNHWIDAATAAARPGAGNGGHGALRLGKEDYAQYLATTAAAHQKAVGGTWRALGSARRAVEGAEFNGSMVLEVHREAMLWALDRLSKDQRQLLFDGDSVSWENQRETPDQISYWCGKLEEYAEGGGDGPLDAAPLYALTNKYFESRRNELASRLEGVDKIVEQAEARSEDVDQHLPSEDQRGAIRSASEELAEELSQIDWLDRTDGENGELLAKLGRDVEKLEQVTQSPTSLQASKEESSRSATMSFLRGKWLQSRKHRLAERLNAYNDRLDEAQDSSRLTSDTRDSVAKGIGVLMAQVEDLDPHGDDQDEIEKQLKQLEAAAGEYQQHFPDDRADGTGSESTVDLP